MIFAFFHAFERGRDAELYKSARRDREEPLRILYEFMLRHWELTFHALRTISSGIFDACRTASIVLPKKTSPIRRCPCVVIAIKSQ